MNLKPILAAVAIVFSASALAQTPAPTPGAPGGGALKADREAIKADREAMKADREKMKADREKMRQDRKAARAAKKASEGTETK